MLWPEQKRMFVMQTLVEKYFHTGDLVDDPFAGSDVAGGACLSLLLHLHCILVHKDVYWNKYAIRQLGEVFAPQGLNLEFDITESIAFEEAATLLHKTLYAISTRKAGNVWRSPTGHPLFQMLLPELVNIFRYSHRDYSLSSHGRQLPMNRWRSTLRVRFNALNPSVLLGLPLSRNILEVRTFRIQNAVIWVFKTDPIGENTVIRLYYGTLFTKLCLLVRLVC